jgi:hypothetical protein
MRPQTRCRMPKCNRPTKISAQKSVTRTRSPHAKIPLPPTHPSIHPSRFWTQLPSLAKPTVGRASVVWHRRRRVVRWAILPDPFIPSSYCGGKRRYRRSHGTFLRATANPGIATLVGVLSLTWPRRSVVVAMAVRSA